MSHPAQAASAITHVQLKVGLEIHVELATATKMFSRAPNLAAARLVNDQAEPNTLIDPVVLGLPGALPVLNREAVGKSIAVGLALGCSIATTTRWDRKSYFYPDMPKNYQISQFELPLCFDGAVDLPPADAQGRPDFAAPRTGWRRIGIIRAHLEEDAGKLLHELPGGFAADYSIVDLNRAGTPLLEIVTQPDFDSADQVVLFCQMLRDVCRGLGASEGVLQKGHMRFEPNINCILTLADGRRVVTPVVEVKNLNSFKAVRGAIEFELADQPKRWLATGREMARGAKSTRGWDDVAGVTVPQREKEEAADYRYFPDPDLLPVPIERAWVDAIRSSMPDLPLERLRLFTADLGLSAADAHALVDEPAVAGMFQAAVDLATTEGTHADLTPVPGPAAAKAAANLLLQSAAKRANEATAASAGHRIVLASDLGFSARQLAVLVLLREHGRISAQSADELLGLLCEPERREADPAVLAAERKLLILRDDAAIDRWCDAAIAQNPQPAADVRAGKDAAIGRLVGAAMKCATAEGAQGDAKLVRERLLGKLRGGG